MRIAVVDGNPEDREVLAGLVREIHPECELVGIASDGEAGYRLIMDERPDLVIMDVQLPGRDGLTMLEKLRSEPEQARTKVLILIGDREFEAVRQAMELDVEQYLLKPIDQAQVRQAVVRIAEKIGKERMLEETFTVENIFISCLNGNIHPQRQFQTMMREHFGFTLEDPGAVLTVWLGSGYAQQREKVRAILENAGRTQGISICVLEVAIWRMVVAVVCRVSEDKSEYIFFKETAVPMLCRNITGEVVCMWNDLDQLSGLLEGMKELRNLCEWNLTFDRGDLVRPEDIENLDVIPLRYSTELEERLRKAVVSADGEEIKKCYYRIYDLFRREAHDPGEIKESLIRFNMAGLDTYKTINVIKSEVKIQHSMQEIAEAVSWEQIRKAMEGFLDQMVRGAFEDSEDEWLSPLVRKAIQLVRKYYDQGITLEETADRLFVSEEYLSTQFKKETGKGFVETVRSLRIERIKGLLVNTHLKVNQIAELTGYADPKYMSRVFKEETGMLPTEYRKTAR